MKMLSVYYICCIYSNALQMLHWFGHLEHSSGAVRTACDIQVENENDCMSGKIRKVDSQESSTWRSGVSSAMSSASQLPRRAH